MRVNAALIKKRLSRLADKLDSPVIIPRWEWYNPNFLYFTGMDVDHSIALADDGGLTIFTVKMNEGMCRKIYGGIAEVVVFTKVSELKEKIKGAAIDASYIPYVLYRRLYTRGIKSAEKELGEIREVKDSEEIGLMRDARKKTLNILRGIKAMGRREDEVKLRILVEIVKTGGVEAFSTIVANSRNARFPHYASGNSRIDDYALIDMGVRHKYYNADITRCIGKMGEMEKTYAALQHTAEEVSDVAYAGREIRDFIAEVGRIIKKNGLKEFPHGIGHGIGLEVHELPWLSKKAKGELKENSIITIEPGQYEKKGARYEDMYVIGKKCAKLMD